MLPDSPIGFLDGLVGYLPALEAHFRSQGVSLKLGRADPTDPVAYAREFEAFADGLDACAVLGPNDPAMVDAVRRLEGNDLRVATLISDLPSTPRTLFAGPDNTAMGATAGQLATPILRITTGIAAVVKPPSIQEDHEARFIGFHRALQSGGIESHRLRPLIHAEGQDAADHAEALARGLGDARLDTIYMTGGNTAVVVAALEMLAHDSPRLGRPMIIGTDLTPKSSKLLIERRLDAVVASDAQGEMRDVVAGLLRKLTEPLWQAENSTRPVQVYTRFNIPAPNSER